MEIQLSESDVSRRLTHRNMSHLVLRISIRRRIVSSPTPSSVTRDVVCEALTTASGQHRRRDKRRRTRRRMLVAPSSGASSSSDVRQWSERAHSLVVPLKHLRQVSKAHQMQLVPEKRRTSSDGSRRQIPTFCRRSRLATGTRRTLMSRRRLTTSSQ